MSVTELVASGLNGTGSAFLRTFVRDGAFQDAYEGHPGLLRKLELGSVPLIVLGRRTSSVASEPLVDKDYLKATTTLSVRVFKPAEGFTSRSVVVDGIGPGFSSDVAQRAADRAAVAQLLASINSGGE
jgi:hypothetical protein